MKKKFIACALIATSLSLTALCGCVLRPISIVSIDKTDSAGLIDYYTITYSDGSTSTFSVTNGKNGEDGQDAPALTVDDVYEFYKQTDPDMTKEEFINKFLSIEGGASQDNLTALSSLFRSGVKIYSVFKERQYNTLMGRYTEIFYKGSAVIYRIDEDYSYILTNYHMVYNANDTSEDKICYKIYAYMYGSEYSPVCNADGELVAADSYALDCEYVGGSADCDVAVIKVPTSKLTATYPQAKQITVNSSYEVGQTVYALGNPNGEGLSLTKGIVSVDLEQVTLDVAGTRTYHLLRTDADLDHGSSGGGLFNADGEFIALCNSGDDEVQSINFAVPAVTVVPCVEGILYYNGANVAEHSTYRMLLGVTVQESNCRYEYDGKTKMGKIVAELSVAEPDDGEQNPMAGRPAQKMGLQVGDKIKAISINGTKYTLNRMFEISNVLMRARVGDSVTITYARGGEESQTQAYTVTQDDLTVA